MMSSSLIGAKVRHEKFGEGEVVDIGSGAQSTFTVEFLKDINKSFPFPEAFTNHYLTLDDDLSEMQSKSLRERLLFGEKGVIEDMSAGKFRISYDFGEASAFIPPLSVIERYVPNEAFWDLAVKLEYRIGKVISKMKDKNLSVNEILGNDYLNIHLTGEPGCGKTEMITVLASVFGLPLYIVNFSANSEEEVFTGTYKVNDGKLDFCETPFLKAFKYGGIVLLDELNAANPSVTILLNDALIKPFIINEGNIVARTRHPLCVVAAATNPDITAGVCPLNEATERRFNVTKAIMPPDKKQMIRLLVKEGYDLEAAKWAYSAYEKCKKFLKSEEADEVYRTLEIDCIRNVLNDIEEGRDSVKSLEAFYAKAASRDSELAGQLKLLCNSMVRFESKSA